MSRKTIHHVLRSAKTLALVAALGLGFAAPQAIAQAKQVIRISTPAVPDDWHAKMWTVFKDTLEKSAPASLTSRSTSMLRCSSRAPSRRRWRAGWSCSW